jgi:hypothetical protein
MTVYGLSIRGVLCTKETDRRLVGWHDSSSSWARHCVGTTHFLLTQSGLRDEEKWDRGGHRRASAPQQESQQMFRNLNVNKRVSPISCSEIGPLDRAIAYMHGVTLKYMIELF